MVVFTRFTGDKDAEHLEALVEERSALMVVVNALVLTEGESGAGTGDEKATVSCGTLEFKDLFTATFFGLPPEAEDLRPTISSSGMDETRPFLFLSGSFWLEIPLNLPLTLVIKRSLFVAEIDREFRSSSDNSVKTLSGAGREPAPVSRAFSPTRSASPRFETLSSLA